ncbi:hypothetical protein ASG95_07735 [Phycicoccus sp. Soil803]|nr:hypothetical protein ASG95_07735 [Phycicoccus sp. Soil803]
MVMDLWVREVRRRWAARPYWVLMAGFVTLLVVHRFLVVAAVVVVLLAARILWWWTRLTRTLGRRLPDGQLVSVSRTADDQLLIRDSDEVWLPRGSAVLVERIGSMTVVHGRAISAYVPSALLSEADAAFLEGHGASAPAHETTEAAPDLPLSVELTPQVQAAMVAARRRSYLRSGEFGIVVAPLVMLVALSAFLAKPATTLLVAVACCLPMAVALNGMQRSCAALRRAYPVGHTLRARVDEDGLVLTMVHGALRVRWADYEAHRLGPRVVELRTRKGRPLRNLTLPLELFTPEAFQLLCTAVPTSF